MPNQSSITVEKERVEQELLSRESQIKQGFSALQDEVTSVAPSIREAIFGHPLVSLGGALLAGVAVGLLFGGKKKTRESYGAGADHRALVDHYVSAIVEEAREHAARGQDIGDAVQDALKDRVPLIVYEVPEQAERYGLMRYLVRMVLLQLVPVGIKVGMGFLAGEEPHDEEQLDTGNE